jgi:hypothetical protein
MNPSGVSRWDFFSGLPTEPCALGSTQPLKMGTGDFSWGKGGRCVRLTTYHPYSAECQYSGALTYLGHLDGLLWVTFTFTLHFSDDELGKKSILYSG